jgi:hypothetical protein
VWDSREASHLYAQEPALCALYENIDVSSTPQLVSLARCLVFGAQHRCELVRHLAFCFTKKSASIGEMAQRMEASHMILLHATQLQSFSSEKPVAPIGSHLAAIRTVAQSTLQSLHMYLTNERARNALPFLASFHGLRSLHIELGDEDSPPSGFLGGLPPVVLEHVKTVGFSSSSDRWLGVLEDWFFTCKFSTVQKIRVRLPKMMDMDGGVVASFFRAHSSTCSDLTFDGPLTQEGAEIYSEQFNSSLTSTADRLAFESYVPSPRLFEFWVSSAKMTQLFIRALLDDTRLWFLMDEMMEKDFSTQGLKVRIALHDEPFTWDCGDRSLEHATWIGRLLHYVFALARKGVSIEDDTGRILVPPTS